MRAVTKMIILRERLAWRLGLRRLISFCLLVVISSSAYALPFTILDNEAPPRGTGEIYLTFDDGPHPKITPQILAVLEETNTSATFFFIGSIHP